MRSRTRRRALFEGPFERSSERNKLRRRADRRLSAVELERVSRAGSTSPDFLFFDRNSLWSWSALRSGNRRSRRKCYAILERQVEQRIGVHTRAVEFDAPMEMRAGGAAGRSDLTDDLPCCDQVSVFD